MALADFVQTNGFGVSFASAMKRLMAEFICVFKHV
jgi:hypothetical protein